MSGDSDCPFYEPSDDTYLLVDALRKDLELINASVRPSLCVEVGSGSGYVLTALALLLRGENPDERLPITALFPSSCSVGVDAAAPPPPPTDAAVSAPAATARFVATDVNPRAVAATRALGRTVGVEIECVLTDLLAALRVGPDIRGGGGIDVLLFNPPYVPTPSEEIEALSASGSGIAAAWAGGIDGREVVDRFVPYLPRVLATNGVCYLLLVQKNKPFQLIRALKAIGLDSKIVVKRRAQNERLLVLRISRTPPVL
tara:strand:+ start:179 stop:952 length:774 start_codon:yes stop_codon:yes gene_type:complete